jgi:hypothetical protein
VMRSAGIAEAELRALLVALAARVTPMVKPRSVCSPGRGCPSPEASRRL